MCQTDILGLTQGEVLRLWDVSFCQRQLHQRCSVLLSFGFDFFFFVTTVLSGKMSFWWNRNCWRNLTNFDNSAWKGAGEEYLESAGAPSYDIFWMERSFDLFLFLFSKWCFKMFCFVGEQNGWIKCLKKKKRKSNILTDPRPFFNISFCNSVGFLDNMGWFKIVGCCVLISQLTDVFLSWANDVWTMLGFVVINYLVS